MRCKYTKLFWEKCNALQINFEMARKLQRIGTFDYIIISIFVSKFSGTIFMMSSTVKRLR